jgi:hypothetical protein
VGKQHLDLFALSSRLFEGIGFSDLPGNVTGSLINAARDFAHRGIGAALGLAGACGAIMLTRAVDESVFLGDMGAWILEWGSV